MMKVFNFLRKPKRLIGEPNHITEDVNKQLRISTEIDKLKQATTSDEKIAMAKELLLKTDVLKFGNALTPFDDEVWASEKNYLKKYLEHKSSTSTTYYGVDCDDSTLCVVMYTLMNNKLSFANIVNQCSSKQKYEIRCNEARFKGDTPT